MRLRYRCPQCKRWLKHHWTDREDALGLAVGSLEPVAYLVAFVVATLGVILDLLQLLIAIAIIGATVAVLIYRLYLRKGRRYYCAHCDKVFRGNVLRERTYAPQITEIAS